MKYYIAAICAFATWGFFSLVLKPLHHYLSADILFYRVFLCAALMLAIGLFIRRRTLRESRIIIKSMTPQERKRTALLTLGGGLLLTGNWFFFIYAMNHVSVKATSLAYLVCPILTAVLAALILKEHLNKWQWAAVGLSAISCMMLSFNSLPDLFYAVITALSYALYLVIQRRNNALDKFLNLSIQIIFAALILLPFFPVFSGPVPQEAFFYTSIAVIAVLFTIVPLFLNLYALKGINSSTVGMLLYINPIIAFNLAIFHYHEQINMIQLSAYVLILISIIVFNVQLIRKPLSR
ncbi:EamA family transporter [Chitinophaga horti]|uniref:EamA family transporter n=1 Tax=Chitinophaga horti TaxID=2920382 RepID=A0ABY6J3M0_9BACT|nr:EamA family transporter [Chitinophaga horti]UYQ94105.1 EamA family transporter [Chitinophaga horti]